MSDAAGVGLDGDALAEALAATAVQYSEDRYRRVRTRLEASVRSAERRLEIVRGDPRWMRAAWPCDELARLVADPEAEVGEQDAAELIRDLETYCAGSPGGFVVARLKRLRRTRAGAANGRHA